MAKTTRSRSATSRRSRPARRSASADDAAPGRDDKLYYRIGEVSELTGIKPYVLRYWETEFRWMAPQKSRSQQRLYRRKDIENILLIKRLLYDERFTIEGARRRLRELGVGRGSRRPEGESDDPRTALKRIRADLRSLRARLASGP